MSQRLTLLLIALLALSVWGFAQNPPATNPPAAQAAAPAPAVIGPAKIAFVNIQEAVSTCAEGEKELGGIQEFVDKMSSELQSRQKELETLRTQLEVQGSKLTPEAQADLADQIDTKDTDLQRFQQDTQKEIDRRRQRVQAAIARKMLAIIDKVAKEKGLNLVQFIDPNRDGYIDPNLVITAEVIKAYNETHPVAAAAPVKK